MTGWLVMLAAAPLSGVEMTLYVVLLLVLVALSGTFSGSETVLFSLTPVQLERAVGSPYWYRRLAAQLMRRPKQTLMDVLLANTAVNVLLFAVSYVFFYRLAAQSEAAWLTPVSAIASILLVVVFGEVVPKVLGVSLAETLAPFSAVVVRTVGAVAQPVGRVIDVGLAEPVSRLLLGQSAKAELEELSTVELKTLLEMSRRRGTINSLEDTFLRSVIDLGHMRVRDVMVPRVELTAYDVDASAAGLRDLMRGTRHKKVPVYERSKDNIIGMVYAKVLFFNPDRPLRELVSPVRFVPEVATCEQLLRHFRSTKSQIAIVVDEYGGVAGLVTLHDVLEEIVGELHDPEDVVEEPEIRAMADGEYDISGSLSLHYWVETFQLPPRVERVATVGGLVMAQLGRPARVGDRVRLGNVELEVMKTKRRRIDRLRLRLLEKRRKKKK